MAELRWNPLLATYTMVAANRQGRPHLPTEGCPFCPGSGRVPDCYEMLVYPNDFPVLSQNPEAVVDANKLYTRAEAYGNCEVLLYSHDHHKGLAALPTSSVLQLVKLWASRYEQLRQDPKVQYIFPFENRGVEVGVTIHHPHGQLYGYPFVPIKIEQQLQHCKSYFEKEGQCLFDAINKAELNNGERIISQNESFAAYIPWFTDYPYGVFITTLKHRASLAEMDETELADLAQILQEVVGAFDQLFDRPFPYMLCVQQVPVNNKLYADAGSYYYFHIEFYPPLRAADKIKWLASSETGAGAAANPRLVEETAVEMKQALEKYKRLQTW